MCVEMTTQLSEAVNDQMMISVNVVALPLM